MSKPIYGNTIGGGFKKLSPVLQEKTVIPTKESQEVTADSEHDGLSKVVVESIPDEYVIPNLQEKTAVENGEVIADEGYDGLSKVTVNVPTESGEVIPEISEVESFTLYTGTADEGSLEIGYDVSERVALPEGSHLLASIEDENYKRSNIKKGESIFGLEGSYEVAKWDGTGVVIEAIEEETATYTITVTKQGVYTGTSSTVPTYIKFGSAPTSASDYDYSSEKYYGSETTLGTVEASVAYVWGGSFYFDGVSTGCENTYDAASEITFTADTTVSLVYAYGSGGA